MIKEIGILIAARAVDGAARDLARDIRRTSLSSMMPRRRFRTVERRGEAALIGDGDRDARARIAGPERHARIGWYEK